MNLPNGTPFEFHSVLGMRVFFSPHMPQTSPVERDWPVFKLSPNMGCSPEFTARFDAWLAATFGLEKRRTVMIDEPVIYIIADPTFALDDVAWRPWVSHKAIVTHPANRPLLDAAFAKAGIGGVRAA